MAILYMTVFCAVSPVGVGVGMALTDPSQVFLTNQYIPTECPKKGGLANATVVDEKMDI